MASPTAIILNADDGAGDAILKTLSGVGYSVHGLQSKDRAMVRTEIENIGQNRVIEILVNNLPSLPHKRALEMSPREFADALDRGLNGVFSVSRETARHAVQNGRQLTIINILAVSGMIGLVSRSAEAAVSAGILAATKALAVEWAPKGIRVNAVVIGPTDDWLGPNWTLDEIPGALALDRTVSHDDIANAVSWLATSAPPSIIGEAIVVDGGWLANGWRRDE